MMRLWAGLLLIGLVFTAAVPIRADSLRDAFARASRPQLQQRLSLPGGVRGRSPHGCTGCIHITAHGVSVRMAGTSGNRIRWTRCGKRLECARVQVPLDWSQSHGRTITLAVIRYLATRPQQRIGSLFFNPGGPGVSGVDTLRRIGAEMEIIVHGRFDIVSWDPRGTGASTHVQCFGGQRSRASFYANLQLPTTPATARRYLHRAVTFARQCGHLSGALLGHISTADTARDLDELRRLVGDRQLTYAGQSYGTFLGQVYANMFPRRVRAMVLDGAVDPVAYSRGAVSRLSNTMAATDLVFGKFESLCQRAGPALCALAGRGSVARRINRLLARLQRVPIPAPSAAPPRRLTYGDALIAIYTYIGSPEAWPQLADRLNRAANGDGSSLVQRARAVSRTLPTALPPAAAIACADSPSRQSIRAWPRIIHRLTRVSRLYGPILGWWLWAPCASWPAHSAEHYTGPWRASTKNPILVIGTRFDPNTPFVNAHRIARLLGNAILLTHQGFGHVSVSDPSSCVERATGRYLVDLIPPARGTVCPADRLPFDPNFGHKGAR